MKVSIIGTGAYGIAIASALSKNSKVYMYTENPKKYKEFQKTGKLKSIINYDFNENIVVSDSYEEVLKDTKAIFIICASKYVDSVLKDIKKYYKKKIPVCIASKGIEESTGNLLSDLTQNILQTKNIAVISGPTFAIDMVNNEPVALAIASSNIKTYRFIYSLLSNETLKLRKSTDMIGIQICGSIKNIIAIASGILCGLGYSSSTQAFLINESLHDIKKLISCLGGKRKTILSFAGVGDLLMTSMSEKSRNYCFGKEIATAKNSEEIKEYLKNNTVEGYHTLKTIIKLLNRKKIDMPLIYLIDDIIKGKKSAEELPKFLINKE